jgi:hypothetical protein
MEGWGLPVTFALPQQKITNCINAPKWASFTNLLIKDLKLDDVPKIVT